MSRYSVSKELITKFLTIHGESFGLDLVENSNGTLWRGTVYVILFEMEEEGLISSRKEPAPRKGCEPRRLYKIKEK